MKQVIRNLTIFLCVISLTACAANNNGNQLGNEAQDHQADNYATDRKGNQLLMDDNNDFRTNDLAADNGLSQEIHGHISNRPETKQKKNKKNPPSTRNVQVQLLGINDLHGQLNVTRKVAGQSVGRADYLATYLKHRKVENAKSTLLVHAGDMIGASPPVSALLKDEPTIDFLNTLGFSVGTVGNHEFDRGVDELKRLVEGRQGAEEGNFGGANFPWVAANVVYENSGEPIFSPYEVIRVNGMPIGFIGVCLTDTPNIVIPSGVAGLKFTDEAETINRYAAELKKQGVRAIIVLAHNPGSSSSDGSNASGELVDIANSVDDEVDIIFGGHNHAYMNATVDGKLLVQSYSYGTAFSDVDLEIDPKTKDIVSKQAEIITTFHTDITPDQDIAQMISGYEEKVKPIVNRVVGTVSGTLSALRDANGESALGNLIADAQRTAMKTEFAFMNPGGIRADLEEGEITWGEIYTVQPFNNDLVKMTLTGSQIRTLLNQQWGGPRTHMLQISGLTYTWDDNRPVGEKIVDIYHTDGTEIDPNKDYTVTVNVFLAGGGDGFTILKEGRNREVGPVDIDALVDYIEGLPKPFSYGIEGRIKKLEY